MSDLQQVPRPRHLTPDMVKMFLHPMRTHKYKGKWCGVYKDGKMLFEGHFSSCYLFRENYSTSSSVPVQELELKPKEYNPIEYIGRRKIC